MKNLLGLGLIIFLAGCSGGAGGSDVSGKITFSDGSPLTKGVVVYSSETGTFRGNVGADGTYTVKNVVDGTYNVAITGAKEGTEVPEMQYDEDGNYIEPKETSEPKSLIKEEYSDPAKSGLSVTVPGDYDLTVEKPE